MKITFKSLQKISLDDIDHLENSFQIKLPIDYKNFLLINNGGETEEIYCFHRKINEELTTIAIEKFLSVEEIHSTHENLKDMEFYEGMLPIAVSVGSPVICIGIDKKNNGQIIVIDWDFGATIQNQSFDDFLNSLKKCN